jgi:hypothetical protein
MSLPEELPVVPPDGADALPRHTTPTWEVELLISGVAVFAMLQLPGWLDDRWFALRPRLDLVWREPFLIIYVYAKCAALILAATFVIHLLLRARWIAQVGMNSVHPDGIRWDRLRMGPVQREVEQAMYGSAEASVDRADNRATTVFAIGVMLASLLVATTVFVLVAVCCVLWAAQRLGFHPTAFNVLIAMFALLVVPVALANRIDRARGNALARDGLVRRALAVIFSLYGRAGMGRGNNPTLALMASHAGPVRMVVFTTTALLLAVTVVMTSYDVQRDPASLGQYARFPQFAAGSAQVMDAAHYDDTRNAERDPAVPYIQSAVIAGPYLRLVVPYQPASDDVALQDQCTGTGADTRLACLQRFHAVRLDGRPVAADFATGSDPRTDRPALVSMIDIRALAPGRHELQVSATSADARPAPPDRIAFWR